MNKPPSPQPPKAKSASLPRRAELADRAGVGISPEEVEAAELPKPATSEPPVWSLDPKAEWIDEPTIENQLRMAGAWKHDHRETKVFDLSEPEQLQKFNDIQTKSVSKKSNVFLTIMDKQFNSLTGSWKILVTLDWVKYKKLVKSKLHEQKSVN